MSTLPPGATSSAASSPVSPGPAASSSTRCPGCGSTASTSQCDTGAHRRAAASRAWRFQPAASASQRSRALARRFGSTALIAGPCAANLPEAVRGSAAAKAIALGTLKPASRAGAARAQRLGLERPARPRRWRRPPRPTAGRARPWTAASATAGWASSTASTSAGATFSPPVTIVSALRPVTRSARPVVDSPRSPVARPARPRATVGPPTRISPSSASARACRTAARRAS